MFISGLLNVLMAAMSDTYENKHMLLPGVKCALHIFEPRYRLMVRRCMESGFSRFGMVSHTHDAIGYAQVGTTAEIRAVQLLPDGRFLLETVGGRRFQVQDRSVRNGYHVAQVSWLDDFPPSSAESEALLALRPPQALNRASAEQLVQSLTASVLSRMGDNPQFLEQVGLPPADVATRSFWLAAVLVPHEEMQYHLLQERVLETRADMLLAVVRRLHGPSGPPADAEEQPDDDDDDEDDNHDEEEPGSAEALG